MISPTTSKDTDLDPYDCASLLTPGYYKLSSDDTNTQSHCPLCIPHLKNAEKSAFIFLGVQGVLEDEFRKGRDEQVRQTLSKKFAPRLNHRSAFTKLQHYTAKAQHLDQNALKNLYTLIEKAQKAKINVFIILITFWANAATLEEIRGQMFAAHQFSQLIVGKIPPTDFMRWAVEIKRGHSFETIAKEEYGIELKTLSEKIEFWLRRHQYPPERTNYVILDNETLLYPGEKARDRSIHVDFQTLLSEENVEQAYEKLVPEAVPKPNKKDIFEQKRPLALRTRSTIDTTLEKLPAQLATDYCGVLLNRAIFERSYKKFISSNKYLLEEGTVFVEMECKKGRSDMKWSDFWYDRCCVSVANLDGQICKVVFEAFSHRWNVGKDRWGGDGELPPFDKVIINGIKSYPACKEVEEIDEQWIDKQFED